MPSSHKPLHRCKENGQYVCGSSGLTKEMAIFQGVPNFSKYTHYCIHPHLLHCAFHFSCPTAIGNVGVNPTTCFTVSSHV